MAIDLKSITETMVRACPEMFEVKEGQLCMKFDTISLFYSDEAESNVVQYNLKGKQVMWIPAAGPKVIGEFVISDMIGLLPIRPM